MAHNFFSKIRERLGFGVKSTNPIGTFSSEDFPAVRYLSTGGKSDLDTCSIIAACTLWSGRQFPEAPLVVCEDQDGDQGESEQVIIKDHLFAEVMREPNPFHSRSVLWQALIPDIQLAGESYLLARNNGSGFPAQYWWAPSWTMEPKQRSGSGKFIDYYEYTVNGKREELDPRKVIHFRDGINPDNPRKGFSKVRALLREVLTDNEAAIFTQYVLKNGPVTGMIIAPKSENGQIEEIDAIAIESKVQQKLTGEGRGRPMVLSGTVDVHNTAISPADMIIDKVRRIPEERISAIFGIPAIVAGLGAGLERSTMANYREAREQAMESLIVPLQRIIAEQLDIQALPRYPDYQPGQYCWFDTRKVRVFQEDENKKHERVRSNWQQGMYTLGQCGRILGFEVDPAEEKLRIFDFQTGVQVSAQAKAKMRMRGRRAIFEGLIDDSGSA